MKSYLSMPGNIDLEELVDFLVRAKRQTYAGDGKEITPQRPGFKELEYRENEWEYRDSYTGFYVAPGQEIVRFQRDPIWVMAYSGGMHPEHHGNKNFAQQTFAFLKKALLQVQKERPFRGPKRLFEGDYTYIDTSEGDVKDFRGTERIFYKGEEVFSQDYMGGLVIQK